MEDKVQVLIKAKDAASKEIKRVQAGFKNFVNSFKAHWLAITAAITAGILIIRKLTSTVGELVKLSAEQELVFRKLQVAVENAGGATEKLQDIIKKMPKPEKK